MVLLRLADIPAALAGPGQRQFIRSLLLRARRTMAQLVKDLSPRVFPEGCRTVYRQEPCVDFSGNYEIIMISYHPHK